MSDVQWIKILTGIFEDDKIRLIQSMPEGDSIVVMWFKLLTQAGKGNQSGYVCLNESTPYTADMLVVLFNKSKMLVDMALKVFAQFGMIEIDEQGFIYIVNWEKHQSVDKLDKIREQNRLRKQNQREREKVLLPAPVTQNVTRHANVTQGHATELELDLELDLETEKNKKKNKYRYAEFVLLTDEEYDKLCNEFGKVRVDRTIETLDEWQGNQPEKKRKKDHYKTIRVWINKDDERKSSTSIRTSGGNMTAHEKKKADLIRQMQEAQHEQGGSPEIIRGNHNRLS